MATLHLLGTGAGISDPERGTTMLAFADAGNSILVDCGGDAIRRAARCGLDLNQIEALIVTHEHPDHVSGFPLLIEKLWLAKRNRPLKIYGPAAGLNQARKCFEAFTLRDWPGMIPLEWHPVRMERRAPVLSDDTWDIVSSPTKHPVDTIGLRVTHKPTGSVLVYSCDTAPCPNADELAFGAGILVHEATEFEVSSRVHTSVLDAAKNAAKAGVKKLILVHLPPGMAEQHLVRAREIFPDTQLGDEYGSYPFL